MAKLTAEMTDNGKNKKCFALHVDGVLVKQQVATKIEHEVGELDRFTVTFNGRMDSNGVIHICEVK